MRIGLTPLGELDPVALYVLPPVVVPSVGTIDELIAKAPVLEATGALAQHQDEVAALRQALAWLPAGNPGRPGLEEELAKAEAKVQRLVKRAPSAKLQVEHLRSAKQAQRETAAAQEQRATAGREKALERQQLQLKAVDEYISTLTARRKGIVDAFAAADAAWKQFHDQRKLKWNALCDEIDANITELEVLNNPMAAPPSVVAQAGPGPVAPAQPLTGGLMPDQGMLAIKQAEEDAKKANEALKALQEAHKKALAAKEAAEKQTSAMLAISNVPAHLETFEVTAADLPTMLPEPQPDQWPQYHKLWCILEALSRQEAIAGMQVPVSFAQLQAGLEIPRALVGEVIWRKAFPGPQPTEEALVTAQLRQFCWMPLNMFSEKLVKDKARQDASAEQTAKDVEAVVTDYRAKRRKASEMDPAAASAGTA